MHQCRGDHPHAPDASRCMGFSLRNGAFACLLKAHTSDEKLDNAINSVIAMVGMLPKEDRHRPF